MATHNAQSCTARVPRLDGAPVGVFGTRTPHRPNPIGLSVAEVSSVDGREVHLRGADVVDGTPVIDIKPYVPFCDAVGGAAAPPWVREEDAALALEASVDAGALEAAFDARWALHRAAPRRHPRPLYGTAAEFAAFARQVLSIDFRSTHKRTGRAAQGSDYNVTLDGVRIHYGVAGGAVRVTGAEAVERPPRAAADVDR